MGTKRITLSIYEGIQGLRSKYQTNPKLDTLDKNKTVRINNSSMNSNKDIEYKECKKCNIPLLYNGSLQNGYYYVCPQCNNVTI